MIKIPDLFLVAALGFIFGCFGQRQNELPKGSGYYGDQRLAENSNILRINNHSEPETIDPSLCLESVGAVWVENLFARLVGFDPHSLAPQPEVALHWDISSDQRTYRFFLRDSYWSDGHPVTSFDFMGAWMRAMDPHLGSLTGSLFKDIEGVDVWQKNPTTEPPKGLFAPNPSVLEIHLKKPVPYFLGLLSSGPFSPVPMHVLKRLEHEGKSPEDWIKLPNIVSNGPYMLTHAHFKYEMILEKNPHYWQKQELFFDKIHVYSIGDVYTALHLYEYGNLDWLGPNSSLPVEMSAILARTPDIFQEPQFASQFLWLNIRHPLLRNIKIREALSLAIQRQHLVERIASGSPVAQGGLVPQGIPGYPVAAIPVYDPERARRLLAEAGYPDGKLFPGVLRLLFNHDAGTKMLMEAIAHMWERELGIKTQLVTQEWQTYLHTLDTGDFDIARGGWGGDYLDPTTFLHTVLSRAGGNNVSGWYDARYETLLEKADNLSSPTTRLERLAEAEKLALEAYPLIPLFQRQSITLRKPYLKGLFPHPLQRHPFKWIYLDRKEYISPSSAAY